MIILQVAIFARKIIIFLLCCGFFTLYIVYISVFIAQITSRLHIVLDIVIGNIHKTRALHTKSISSLTVHNYLPSY